MKVLKICITLPIEPVSKCLCKHSKKVLSLRQLEKFQSCNLTHIQVWNITTKSKIEV